METNIEIMDEYVNKNDEKIIEYKKKLKMK
jgi:hypothetical protein